MSIFQDVLRTGVEFVGHFAHLAHPTSLLLMCLAVVVGIFFGVLPGLSATIGIALFAGLTYGMALDQALVILFGVYIGAIYGGSITAILINIPGTGSAAATCLDGYPLALQGQAHNANVLARISSVIGTAFGLLAFLLFTPLLTKLALQFTSPEFFWLAIFGVLICGSLASPDLPVKGWIAGLLGILMAMVGQEDIHGWERLTFGNADLITGIPFVPMTIAFFGVPQIVKSMTGPANPVQALSGRVRLQIWPLIRRNLRNILRWGLIGVGIGAVPGVGENIAAWLAYDDARRRDKSGQQFGTGVYEGVMAPETANNAAIGGSIIPLVTLGIPGSPPAAMLLAALVLHGIRPGPMLTTEHPGIIGQFGAIILWGTLFLFVCGLLLTRVAVKVLRISPRILMPIIAVLCVIGTYAYNNNPFHLKLVFVFGVAGYFLDKMGYAPAPLILGLILGNLADTFFRRALLLSDGNLWGLINRPIAFLFFATCVIAILSQVGVMRCAGAKWKKGWHRWHQVSESSSTK
jgi:putative tricarboxylic transport membrane protein